MSNKTVAVHVKIIENLFDRFDFMSNINKDLQSTHVKDSPEWCKHETMNSHIEEALSDLGPIKYL